MCVREEGGREQTIERESVCKKDKGERERETRGGKERNREREGFVPAVRTRSVESA